MRNAPLHMVPRLPPPTDGVGSFALVLAEGLRERGGLASRFLVASPGSEPGPETAGVEVAGLQAQDRSALSTVLSGESTVLLHYVNYGYESRGCPDWLVAGLERWKATGTDRHLVTVFHEVYASGPPWRSSFWLSPRQRQLAARLVRLSDAATASLEVQAAILRRWRPEGRIAVNPVFSTIGEPAVVPSLAGRFPRLIVFGGPGARRRAWGEARRELLAACRALGAEEVWDVGPPAGAPAQLDGLRVRELGVLTAAEASNCLLGSAAGFLAYPPALLGKSTTFAAYCAHGLLPVCAWPSPARDGGPFVPFWQSRPGAVLAWDERQRIADQARAWYRGHSLDHHAASYRDLLGAS